ncbi:hypothetical protein [Methylobacterium sp. MA0201]|uniref:hypothetical protein n=1 Tax=Methylobacterium alsaeris TaxID=3344826 RepID=UPI0013F0D09F|nr:hypothetical protein [Methylobacterium sp. DB0501]
MEFLLAGFRVICNARGYRVLEGLSPVLVLLQHPEDKPGLARAAARKTDPATPYPTLEVVADAKEVSQPDMEPGDFSQTASGHAVIVAWKTKRLQ